MADRDRHRVITPPAGVATQIARPLPPPRHPSNAPRPKPDNWDDDATPLPVDPGAALTVIAARAKRSTELAVDTKAIAADTKTLTSTAIEVAGDTRRGVRVVDGKVEELAISVARMEGALAELMKDREEQRVIRIEAARAEIDLDRTSRIDAIEARKARRAFVSAVAYKVLAGVSVLASGVMAAMLAGRGC